MFIKVSDPKSAEDFKTQTNNGYWVILYYADWCPHCVAMKPEWKLFADKYSSSNKINVAELESQFLDMVGPQHKANVQGFPTIISLNKGSKVANFMGPRTSKDIDMFANSHLSGVTNHSSNLNKILRNNLKKTKKTRKTKKTKKSKKTRSRK
jgi:thioredoxin-like negative regulator of GroEL